ncbi:ribonuclease P protein component [Arthrobacter sp. TMN-37]
MLAKIHRVRVAGDFARTVRSGARSGRRNVVIYAASRENGEPTRCGFIVGKNVGNAVRRNLVKRRLRAAAASFIDRNPQGLDLVVRALPASALAGWDDLSRDFHKAAAAALQRCREREGASS